MKLFIRILCTFLLFISSLSVAGSLAAQNLMTSELSEVAYQQLEIGNRLADTLSVANDLIQEENLNKFVEITNKIRTSDHLDDLVSAYAKTFIDDLLQEDESKRSQHDSNVNEDAKNFVLSFSPELKTVLPDVLNDEQKQTLLETAVSNIDFNTYYQDALNSTRASMSPTHLSLLQLGDTLAQPFVFTISIILMAVSLLILIILDVMERTWGKAIAIALSLSGFILLIARLIAPMMLSQIINRLSIKIGSFGDTALQLLLIFGIIYFVSGLVSFIVSVRITNTE